MSGPLSEPAATRSAVLWSSTPRVTMVTFAPAFAASKSLAILFIASLAWALLKFSVQTVIS
jgi:hypothetical protein